MTSLCPSLCSADAFSYPSIPNVQVVDLQASQVSNISQYIPEWYYYNHGSVMVHNTSFCNVTVTYKHTGKSDTVHVGVFLPNDDSPWNGRLQGIGGNGYTAGLTSTTTYGMIAAVAEGYVAITTDGGHTGSGLASWAFLGNTSTLDYDSIDDFAFLSLNDAALIGKNLAESAYGSKPAYSYFTGCSQGGRQGLELAQRYPDAYNGIAASAPAINWPQLALGGYWTQFAMNQVGEYPHPCEINAITAVAISACDAADGLVDGILSNPDSCTFNPFSMVGKQINCIGETASSSPIRISAATAHIVNASWTGARDSQGRFLWYGYNPGTALTGGGGSPAPAGTKCTNGTCVADPSELFTFDNITHEEYDHLFHKSVQQWNALFGSNNPDLSKFREAGGKMLTYHGLMDQAIPPNGTRSYYEAATDQDSNIHGYYRLFEAPMMGHCYGQHGGQPSTMFDSLVAWVENGTAPDSLPIKLNLDDGRTYNRILCPYPQRVQYKGTGNVTSADSFYCAE